MVPSSPFIMRDILPPWMMVGISASVFFMLWTWSKWRSAPNKLPLPPSPPGLPFIGNILDVPTKDMESAFWDLNDKFGDIVYLNACGQPMIVLGTHEAAVDLLEKRSSNYSDRQFSSMSTLTGWTWLFSTSRYGPEWRHTRRLFHEYMNSNAVPRYHAIQEVQTHRYLLRILQTPGNFLQHGRQLFGSSIIRVGYGIDVDKSDVDYFKLAEEAMATFSLTFLPGKYLVETFPILRHLPSWSPGAQFKRDAAEYYPLVRRMCDAPWQAAISAMREGKLLPSMASALLERISHLEEREAATEEEFSKNAVASAYAGGADTTLSTLQTFYIAMASFPEVQRRAQAELDAVVGPHRLPTFADRLSLPYTNALHKECLRWRPVVPLALVHLSIDEDEYRGYRIPKGSSVVVSPWAYARDPKHYPDPLAFKPERFLKDGKLDPSVLDPGTMVFGYGRRICPGRHFADTASFIAICSVLHAFSISPPLDESGRPVDLAQTVKMSHGVISYPLAFDCVINPRTANAEALIYTSCKEDELVDV